MLQVVDVLRVLEPRGVPMSAAFVVTALKPPKRVLVSWCPVCGAVHAPYVLPIPFDLAPKARRKR